MRENREFDRNLVKTVREKDFLLMYFSETALYKPEQQKSTKILQLPHTPTYQAQAYISEENINNIQ